MKFIFLFLWVCMTTFAHAKSLNQVVVFGDSLSDRGNLYEYMHHQLPMSPPYYEGRFTNGEVWIDLFIRKLYPQNSEAHLLDYAYGGANVGTAEHTLPFSLQNQLKTYFSEHTVANSKAMYVIWIGSNNYLDLPDDPQTAVTQVISGIVASIEQLAQKGAKNFFIINVPSLETTPAAIEFEAEAELKYMSDTHNQRLKEQMQALRQLHPELTILEYDITEIMNDIVIHPQAHDFKDGKRTCCEFLQDAAQDVSVEQLAPELQHSSLLKMVSRMAYVPVQDQCYDFLFFDLYHPTAHAHWLMSEEFYRLFAKHDLQFE